MAGDDAAPGAETLTEPTSPTRLPPVGFWSYARQDDELSFGKLSTLRSLLVHELQQQYGRQQVELFQDSTTIPHGAEWENEINKAIGVSTFFIPIVTPNFIQSEWCTREVELFLEREKELQARHPALGGRRTLFPILFIDIEDVDPESPEILAELQRLQWFDFRRFRHRDYEQADVREAIAELAAGMRSLLKGRLDGAGTDPPGSGAGPAQDKTSAPTMVAAAAPSATTDAPRPAPARPIQVGDVLNHLFEVKRFIKAGGMGQVFEGANVNTGERVAIKALLPSLAADAKVVEMFQREALTLTRLSHEALVQYRVLGKEPERGSLYIVTEYIDGVDLNDALDHLDRNEDELRRLLARLAAGLAAAHRLGAIHRDMSPDNVMLPGGDLHEAKIIDFGIAKDLEGNLPTLVGSGFAGKLNFVAPEQLGEHDGEIGPWTDVYSLALVILCVARGEKVDMSGSFADAVRKRREGPDLAVAPEGLRPLLEDMLRVDPAERIRSMDEVIARLAEPMSPTARRAAGPSETTRPAIASPGGRAAPFRRPARLWLGLGGAALAILLVAVFLLMPGRESALASASGTDENSLAAASTAPGSPQPADDDTSWLIGRWCIFNERTGRPAINIATGQPIEWRIDLENNRIVTSYLGERQTDTIRRILPGEVETERASYARDIDGDGIVVREPTGVARLEACP